MIGFLYLFSTEAFWYIRAITYTDYHYIEKVPGFL